MDSSGCRKTSSIATSVGPSVPNAREPAFYWRLHEVNRPAEPVRIVVAVCRNGVKCVFTALRSITTAIVAEPRFSFGVWIRGSRSQGTILWLGCSALGRGCAYMEPRNRCGQLNAESGYGAAPSPFVSPMDGGQQQASRDDVCSRSCCGEPDVSICLTMFRGRRRNFGIKSRHGDCLLFR